MNYLRYIYENIRFFIIHSVRCIVLVLLFSSFYTLAFSQEIINVETKTFQIGPICEGQIFEIGKSTEISCFHIRTGTRNCISYEPYLVEDKSEDIRITGATPISSGVWREYRLGNSTESIKVMFYNFKAERSATISVVCRSLIEIIIPDDCITSEKTYIQERIYNYNVIVVPKPAKPALTVEKYISPDAIHFIASGCPTDKEGYDYKWNGAFCKEQAGESFGTGNKDGTLTGPGGASFRVLCSALNGTCVSDPTDFQSGLSYVSPDMSQIPPEYSNSIEKIERNKKDNSAGYHYYPVETAICDSGNDNNCTVNNVFNILISSNQFMIPVPSDVGPAGPNNSLYHHVSLSPVVSYGVVGLSGPVIGLSLEVGINSFANMIPNPAMTYIDYSNSSVTNYTLPGHILFPGRVTRQVMQKCGKIYIVTIGEGKTGYDDIPLELCSACPFFANVTAIVNVSQGKRIFTNADNRVINEYWRRFP